MATTENAQLKLNRRLASEWSSENPILGEGEPGWEIDTGLLKVGDGALAWNALDYLPISQAQVIGLTDALASAGDSLDAFFLMGA